MAIDDEKTSNSIRPSNEIANKTRKGEDEDGIARVSMQTPYYSNIAEMHIPLNYLKKSGTVSSWKDLMQFAERRSRVHEFYIAQIEKTKRLFLIITAALILAAALLVTFSPEGRQHISFWIGTGLVLMAAGAAGFGTIRLRSQLLDLKATKSENENPSGKDNDEQA